MNREQAMKKYNLMKSNRHLEEYLDYDPSFLRKLSDADLSYLVEFLEKMYYSSGLHARQVDMQAQSEETISPNEIDDRYMDYEDNAHIIRFARPTT